MMYYPTHFLTLTTSRSWVSLGRIGSPLMVRQTHHERAGDIRLRN